MSPRLLKSTAGFTYLAALMMVIVLGISISAAANSWKMQMQREREAELLFRLLQYRSAIRRWYKVDSYAPGVVTQAVPLNDLKDLLKDTKSASAIRYIRQLYKDPITGKDFVPIKDGTGKIVGVKSSSDAEPIKQANYPDEFMDFEGKKKYSEFEFDARAVTKIRGINGPGGVPKTDGKPIDPSRSGKSVGWPVDG